VWLWVIAVLAGLMAGVALAWARRLSRRLDALTQSYWELRYDYTRLRAHVERLDPERQEPEPAPDPGPSSVTFVPLSTMRKKAEESN
jgi:hypothetical protein